MSRNVFATPALTLTSDGQVGDQTAAVTGFSLEGLELLAGLALEASCDSAAINYTSQ